MLTPVQIAALRDAAGRIADPINDFLIKDIARRVAGAGQLTSTAAYQVYRAQQRGLSHREIQKRLQEGLGVGRRRLRELMTQAAEVGYNFDLRRFPWWGLPFSQNASMQQMVAASVALAQKDFTNLTQTLGLVDPFGRALPLQDAYRRSMDFAFEQVFTGAADYNTAIRQATKHLADQGVRVIDYASGVHTSLEAAVRRNIMGGLGLMAEQISQRNHDDLGCDGWEISAHGASAPDHEPIQGKQYPDAAYQALNNRLKRRIGTLNCGHAAFPIILGVNSPQYSREELEAFRADNEKGVTYEGRHYSLYEATQQQRKLERSIRREKNRILVADAAGDGERGLASRTRLRLLNQEYGRFSKATGLRTQPERAQVAGFGRGQAASASTGERLRLSQSVGTPDAGGKLQPVKIGHTEPEKSKIDELLSKWEAKLTGLDHEEAIVIAANGDIFHVIGGRSIVDTSALGERLRGAVDFHNHPIAKTYYSFSAQDVGYFLQMGQKECHASDGVYRYVLRRTDRTVDAMGEDVVAQFHKIRETEVRELAWNGKINVDVDEYHETVLRLAEKYHFEYERVRIDAGR